ncbi:hypothetical protein JCM16303_005822 [Sporobolomyces ruberrimus]
MPANRVQPPPALCLDVPESQLRSPSAAPAFGISTYSNRVPRSRPRPKPSPPRQPETTRNRSGSQSSGELEGPFALVQQEEQGELEAIASAQVWKPRPQRARASLRQVLFDDDQPVDPPDSHPTEDPVISRKTALISKKDRSIKQQRRTASIYSISSSSVSSLSTRDPTSDQPNTLLPSLLPYSYGPSSLSDSSIRQIRPSNIPSHLPLQSIYASPLQSQHNPPTYSTSPTSPPSPTLTRMEPIERTRQVPPDQTAAAERLKRLYLCPWETKPPPPSHSRPARLHWGAHGSIGIDAGHRVDGERIKGHGSHTSRGPVKVSKNDRVDGKVGEAPGLNEKADVFQSRNDGTVVEVPLEWSRPISDEEREKRHRARNWYLLKLSFLTLLGLVLFADLVILNVKIFIKEDWATFAIRGITCVNSIYLDVINVPSR